MSPNSRYWVVVPAAGASRRMGGDEPKQYLPLHGRTVIEWALQPFLDERRCSGIAVVLASSDVRWQSLAVAKHPNVRTTIGGAERADSVKAGLELFAHEAREDDWVLVHDAARPCLSRTDLDKLIAELDRDPVGGILATPLADTLKRSDAQGRICATVPRTDLWRALTPQMFRYGVLVRALAGIGNNAAQVTDEASAVEALQLQPRLVQGSADNVKITVPGDLKIAERILRARVDGG